MTVVSRGSPGAVVTIRGSSPLRCQRRVRMFAIETRRLPMRTQSDRLPTLAESYLR